MPKILKKILLGVGAFLTLLLAIFAVYETVFAFFGGLNIADGPLTKGDILTSVSIAVAALGAIGGWVLTSQHRQDDIERLTEVERKEIERLAEVERAEAERIAKADAIILYRKLNNAAVASISLLIQVTASPFGNLLERFPGSISENHEEVVRFYGWLQSTASDIHRHLPEANQHFDDLRSLYVYKTAFGDLFMQAIRCIMGLEVSLKGYMKGDPTRGSKLLAGNQKMEGRSFFVLLSGAAEVCYKLERARKGLDQVEYSDPAPAADLIEYHTLLCKAFGVDNQLEGEGVGPEEYVRILSDSYMLFIGVLNDNEISMYEMGTPK